MVITQLDGGADFSEMAKEHSTGPSAQQGGDLGWFPPNRMVGSFSEAIIGMEKGTYSKEPVKTQFGWHVILLEDVRDTTPPSFEQSKERIRAMLRNQGIQNHLAELRQGAQIEITTTIKSNEDQAAPEPKPAP